MSSPHFVARALGTSGGASVHHAMLSRRATRTGSIDKRRRGRAATLPAPRAGGGDGADNTRSSSSQSSWTSREADADRGVDYLVELGRDVQPAL